MAFIQKVRDSKRFYELIRIRPTAYVLLAVIADRARRTTEDPNFSGLEVGEAFIGDYESYGVSRQIYRTDLAFLEKWHFLTIKTTNRGTIVKLIDKTIYDINDEQPTNKSTNSQPTANQQPTTNNNDKNENNEKNDEESTNHIDYLGNIPSSDITYFTERYSVSRNDVILKAQHIQGYYKKKGGRCTNPKKRLEEFLLQDYGVRPKREPRSYEPR